MAERAVKCPVCEKYFKRSEEEFQYHKNRYYHKICFNNKNKTNQDKEDLMFYIQKLLRKKADYKINSQLKNFVDNKKYQYKDIKNALYYFYEIKNNPIAKANGGIGIVPYVIDEAKEYFKEKEERAQNAANIKPIDNTKVIKIHDPTNKQRYKKRTIINISEL